MRELDRSSAHNSKTTLALQNKYGENTNTNIQTQTHTNKIKMPLQKNIR